MAHRAILTIVIAAAASCAGASRSAPVTKLHPAPGRFEGTFRAKLSGADPSRRFVALVDLTDQLDLPALAKRLSAHPMTKASRRAAVVAALEELAGAQQAKLQPLVDRLLAEGTIHRAAHVAIVNRLVVEGTPAGLLALAESPEVAVIRPEWTSDHTEGLLDPPASDAPSPVPSQVTSWAVAAMRADRLWSRGWDGAGIVVGAIDTGAFEAHEQLRGHRVAGARGWFDPVDGGTSGHDPHGHGTAVLSQAVGSNPDGRTVGIAPRASWAAALGNSKNFYARSRMTLAADWILRVARPDVVVNAWSHDEGPCSDFDRPFIDAWRASGIFVVFPAGNGGPASGSGESPAQLAGVFSVAALSPGGTAYGTSSRGPSRCGGNAFPSLSAPGERLPIASLSTPNAYAWGEGTSLSAGLVGGAAALLLSAAPETDPETLERVLVASTRDVPPPGFDEATGAGAIDLPAALALLTGD